MPDFDLNYAAGAFVIFNMSDKIGLQPEVNFVQSGASFTRDYSTNGEYMNDGTTHNVKLKYLEILMLVNINLNESKTLKLQAGPSMGLLLCQKTDDLKNPGADIFTKGQWSAVSGLWVQLSLINFGARYRLGLSNINLYGADEKWHNLAFQVFAGVPL